MKLFASILMKYPSGTLNTVFNGDKAREFVFEIEKSLLDEIIEELNLLKFPFKVVIYKENNTEEETEYNVVRKKVIQIKKRKYNSSDTVQKSVLEKLLNEANEKGLTQQSLNRLYVKLKKTL